MKTNSPFLPQVFNLARTMFFIHVAVILLLIAILPMIQPFAQFTGYQSVKILGQSAPVPSIVMLSPKWLNLSEGFIDAAIAVVLLLGGFTFFRYNLKWLSWILLLLASFAIAVLYFPIFPMLYLPILIRLRNSRWVSVHYSFVFAVCGIIIWSIYFFQSNSSLVALIFRDNLSNAWLYTTAILLVLMIAATAYVVLIFETALRQAQARDELEKVHLELKRLQTMDILNASLRERARISHELHDTLGHYLTAQRFNLQTAQKQLAMGSSADQALESALQRNGDSMAAVRHTIAATQLESMPFFAAVEQLRQGWSQPERIVLRFVGEDPKLSSERYQLLYRGIQELITNAHKHASQEPLTIEISATTELLTITAKNPIQYRTALGSGYGLTALKERLHDLGGKLLIDQYEKEFVVCLKLPLAFAL